jgi:hypothetical protein
MADGSKPGSSSESNLGIVLVGVMLGVIFGIVVGRMPSEDFLHHRALSFDFWLFFFIFTSLLVYSHGWKSGLLRGLHFLVWILMMWYLVPLAIPVFTDGWSGGWNSTVAGAAIGAIVGLLFGVSTMLLYRWTRKPTELVKSDG